MDLIANGPGIGDAMFLSAVAHHYKKFNPNEIIHIVCRYPELYKFNPDVHAISSNWITAGFPQLHDQANIHEHNVQFMLRHLGVSPIPDWTDIRQYLYLDSLFNASSEYITIQATAGNWTRNKNWSLANWKHLVNYIISNLKIRVVQIGGLNEPVIGKTESYMGHSLIKVAKLIDGALLHICPVTGSMHIASGVGTKSIVIYGGRERPEITGYANNINLCANPKQYDCAPCWLVEDCPYGRHEGNELLKPCMDLITVEQVIEVVRHAINS